MMPLCSQKTITDSSGDLYGYFFIGLLKHLPSPSLSTIKGVAQRAVTSINPVPVLPIPILSKKEVAKSPGFKPVKGEKAKSFIATNFRQATASAGAGISIEGSLTDFPGSPCITKKPTIIIVESCEDCAVNKKTAAFALDDKYGLPKDLVKKILFWHK